MTSISHSDASPDRIESSFWEFPLGKWLVLNWEVVLYALILVLAMFTRFYDLGARAVSHDESLHMLYSFKLYDGDGYRHDPMMHGPLLFELNALLYFLFGDSTYVARAGVALFGVALVMLPYWFRPWLGRVGALTASGLILISPAITHYSRHLRHDVFNAVFTVLMFIALFQYLLAWREKDEARKTRWLLIGAIAVALMLSTKELAYIHGFLGITFILAIYVLERLSNRQRRRLFWIALVLFVVVGAIVFWLAVGNAPSRGVEGFGNPAQAVIDAAANVIAQLSRNPANTQETFVASVWKIIQMIMLATGMLLAVSILGLSVDDPKPAGKGRQAVSEMRMTQVLHSLSWRNVGMAAGVGAIVFIVLYTTFFTNPYGAVSGTWGAISYWLSQHDVQRGSQPWYYYLMLLPLYEFLPLSIGAAGGIWFVCRRLRLTRVSSDTARADHKGDEKTALPGNQSSSLDNYFAALLIYWALGNFVIYSWAGEKMPWLSVHLTLPLIFLAAWTINKVVCGLQRRWQREDVSDTVVFALLVLLAGAALFAVLSVHPFQGQSLFDLRDTGQWLGAVIIALLIIFALVHFARRLGLNLASRIAFAVLIVVLTALTIHSSWLVSFINYDNVSEYLFYAHAAPDVTLAMNQIDDLSRRTVGDKLIKVAYDNESTWPLEWYFRDHPNRAYYADTPNRDQLDAPVVIVGATNENKVLPFLGDKYQRFNYRLVWWPLETYKDQTPKKIWNTYVAPDATQWVDETGRQAAWEQIRTNRRELWDIFFYHRHATPKNEWPYVHRFYMYVRKDVLNQLWDYHTGPVIFQEEAEPYMEGYSEIRALGAYGNNGTGNGQFTLPRAVAVGPDGLWYVADSGNNRIQVLDNQGNFIRAWGSAGSQIGQFQEPWGIAVSEDGQVYVADTWNHRIQVFDTEGNYLFGWGYFTDTQGQPELSPGAFWGPRDVALDAEGNVYVADTGNKRIQVFTPDGEFIKQWGGGGVVPGRFEEPTSVTFDAAGNIYVADTWNRRIQVFTPDLTPVTQWSVEGWDSETIINKPFVRVDDMGHVFATDPEHFRVLVFDNQGNFLITFGQYGFDTASFAQPLGMAIDADQGLLVVDSDNNRILKFAPLDLGVSTQ